MVEPADQIIRDEDQPVQSFLGRPLPLPGWLVGYAWLISQYRLKVPPPPRMSAIAAGRTPKSTNNWLILRPARRPSDTLAGHLEFALKYEGVDLSVLKALLDILAPELLAELVLRTPLGVYTRRIWFLYEWLTGRPLPVPDVGKVRSVAVVDPTKQVALATGTLSRRHRVLDNLPGTPQFCPMVRRSPTLETMISKHLDAEAREVVGRTPHDIISRAAAFLLMNDSRSSFNIEGEQPSRLRAARWGQAIGQAGTRALTVAELERLQSILIGDPRMVQLGLRDEGGFVGQHDRRTMEPLPVHISARPDDLLSLMQGLVTYAQRALAGGIDPVVVSAAVAFGFVYVHPLVDGNGRLHRWLIHHVLAVAGYNPPGLVFPISAAILRAIDEYKRVLESYSEPLLPFIEWEETEDHNVRVLNDTARFYRYFDATRHAEFLYQCVEQTVKYDLPNEVRYLESYDRFADRVKTVVEMPDRVIALLRDFLAQNDGKLSVRAREKEFSQFTEEEVRRVEGIYRETLGDLPKPAPMTMDTSP
jgi:Fic family protein